MNRQEAIDQVRAATTVLATSTCDCPYESDRELAAEIDRLRAAMREAMARMDAGYYQTAYDALRTQTGGLT